MRNSQQSKRRMQKKQIETMYITIFKYYEMGFKAIKVVQDVL